MNFSVKNKIFFIFVIVIVTSISIIAWYGFTSAKQSYISSALSINKGETKALSNEIRGILGTVPEDIIYNANFYALEKLLIWKDLEDQKKVQYWENVYVSALKDYVLNKKLYYQIRLLDVNGDETLLLKYDEKTDKIIQTSKEKLSNKSHRSYFKEAIKLKKGELYISSMDLNTENGLIEKPYIPVVRYSTPLVNKNGEVKGVIVLNFNATYLLKQIANAKAIDKKRDVQKYYLINKAGDYLFVGDETKRWGSQLGTDYNFKKDNKDVMEEFKNKDEITFIKNEKIFSMHKIYPDKINNKDRYWYLITTIAKSDALLSLEHFVTIFFTILITVLIIGLFIINRFITKIMTPLEKVTHKLQALSKGIITNDAINYYANDEIAAIVESTAKVIDSIETTILQANAVANGDFSKDIELLSKNDKLGLAIQDMTLRLHEITQLSINLSTGNYNVNVIPRDSNDKLGLALIDMVKYLQKITKVTEAISLGNLDVKYKSQGEDDRLGNAVLGMIEYLRTILKQANAISNGDFSKNIEVLSKNDELGLALATMTDILRKTSIESKKEIYFSEGVGAFSDTLTGISDTIELAKKAISIVSRYVEASSGVVYTYDKDKSELHLIASYAYNSRDSLSNSFKIGEGVVGQVALEKEAILLKNIKDDQFFVQSGTTVSKPKEIFAFPLIQEDELFGVIELMSFESFTELHKEYLNKIATIFATALHSTSQNVQIKMLLEKSQEAFEELQTQSEELQESNVQMEEQQQQLTLQSEELKIKNATLAKAKQEIDERAQELEKASAYKNEFLANMSHELRTPLNSIILLSKLLTQNQNDTLNEKDIEKSKVIHKAGNDLLLLINDILDLSKVESGNMELMYEEVQTTEIVSELKGLFHALAEEKNLNFVLNDEYLGTFSTDKTKLLQVLKNLLSNAFKFTKEGSVSLEIAEIEDTIVFTVGDSGIGIPEDKLNTIFEAFKQVDGSISREYGGTGLGLSISKTIVDLMGGDISVESIYGEGAFFSVTLPLSQSNQSKKPKIELVTKPTAPVVKEIDTASIVEDDEQDVKLELSGKNILIVDDDSRNIFALTSTLENMDAEVFTAFNGQEAMELLQTDEKIDLILMDIMMPIMDGLAAIQNIKANDKYNHIPIIAITAKTMPEDKQQCLDAGANDYLAKPIVQSALVSMMRAWVDA